MLTSISRWINCDLSIHWDIYSTIKRNEAPTHATISVSESSQTGSCVIYPIYTKYPNSKANADTHWTDEFKTVYHPTFSKESKYSGIIDRKTTYDEYLKERSKK